MSKDRQFGFSVPKDLTVLEGATYSPSDLTPTGRRVPAVPDAEFDVRVDGHPFDIDSRGGKWSAWVGCIQVARNFPAREDLISALRAHKPLFEHHFATKFHEWRFEGPSSQLVCAEPGVPFSQELYEDVHPYFRRDASGTSEAEREMVGAFSRESVDEHAFNRAVRVTDEKRAAICADRDGEYLDNWAIENVRTPRLDAVLAAIADHAQLGDGLIDPVELTAEEKRLILVAALADVKLSRWVGPFKDDTPVDECNYLLALTTWLSEYLGKS